MFKHSRALYDIYMHPNSAKLLHRIKENLKSYDLTGLIETEYPRSRYEDFALGTAEKAKENTVKLVEYALDKYRRDEINKSNQIRTSPSRQVPRGSSGRRSSSFGDMKAYEEMQYQYIEQALAGLCPVWPFC